MDKQTRTPEATPCQPPALGMRTPPKALHWMHAKWALRAVCNPRRRDADTPLLERSGVPFAEWSYALDSVAVYMAASGHPLEGFAALAVSSAMRGRFIVADLPRTAKLALDGFAFFHTGRTCAAGEAAA